MRKRSIRPHHLGLRPLLIGSFRDPERRHVTPQHLSQPNSSRFEFCPSSSSLPPVSTLIVASPFPHTNSICSSLKCSIRPDFHLIYWILIIRASGSPPIPPPLYPSTPSLRSLFATHHRFSKPCTMAYQLVPFEGKTLRAFYHDRQGNECLVTTFEDRMPSRSDWVSLEHTPLPPKGVPSPAWNHEGYEYHAFLPKDREAVLNFHLFSCLRDTRVITSDGRFHLDDATKKAWQSLEKNITQSTNCLLKGALVSLYDSPPKPAETFGYTQSHKSPWNVLCMSPIPGGNLSL